MDRSDSRTPDPLSPETDRTGRSPVLDVIAPATGPEPTAESTGDKDLDDVLSRLLDDGEGNPALSKRERAELVLMASYRAGKREAERRRDVLGKLVTEIQGRLLDLIGERELPPDNPFGPEDNGLGVQVRPYIKRPVYPAYRRDEDEQKFTAEDLMDALYGTPAEHVIETKINHNAWQRWVKSRVTKWRDMCGGPAGDGVTRVIDGVERYVDHDLQPISDEECADVTWDGLALPAAIRRVVEPVEVPEIQFTEAQLVSSAAASLDEREAAALAETAEPASA